MNYGILIGFDPSPYMFFWMNLKIVEMALKHWLKHERNCMFCEDWSSKKGLFFSIKCGTLGNLHFSG